jgi:choline dehydrogenase
MIGGCPSEHLRGTGVDVVADLPGVGANLHHHPLAGVICAAAQLIPPAQNKHGEVYTAIGCRPGLTSGMI